MNKVLKIGLLGISSLVFLTGCAVSAPADEATSEPLLIVEVEGSAGILADDDASEPEPIITVEGCGGILCDVETEAETSTVGTDTPDTVGSLTYTEAVPASPKMKLVQTQTASTTRLVEASPVVVPSSPVVGKTERTQEEHQGLSVGAQSSSPVSTPTSEPSVGDVVSVSMFYRCLVAGVEVAYLSASTDGCTKEVWDRAGANTPYADAPGLLPAISIEVWYETYVNGVLVEKSPAR